MLGRALASLALAIALVGPSALGAAEKVVILGFDGADPRLVEQYMAEGLLPNLERLKNDGTFSPLLPTNPPQTPVSWSAFATGFKPGRTDMFDFLQRQPGSYAPDFALAERQRIPFGAGEWNGAIAAGIVGLLGALLVFVITRIMGTKPLVRVAAALVALVGITVGLQGYFGNMLPVELPWAENNRKGLPFWTVAANNDWNVGVVRVPVTFPAEELPAGSEMISGLGVPDIRGRVGTPYLWTTDEDFFGDENEFSLEIIELPAARGVIDSKLAGPYNYPFHTYVIDRAEARWREEELTASERRTRRVELVDQLVARGYPETIDLPIELTISDQDLAWKLGDQQGVLRPGEWSDWVTIDFPINPLVDRFKPLRGLARFKLIELAPTVKFYLSPINFHPTSHPIPYTYPPDLAESLSAEVGLFKTIGWAMDTWSYPTNGLGGIELFLEDMNKTVDGFEKILERNLARDDLDMYIQVFAFTDRAGHLMWYQLDETHPLHEPDTAAKFDAAMREVYARMDAIVGKTMAALDDDTLLMVLSDHGFSSFRRQINYNTWLWQQGYLVLADDADTTESRNLEALFDKDVTGVNVMSGIDWEKTRAWSMGLGAIYINTLGRDPKGTVMAGGEYNQLMHEIQTGLEGLVDEATGINPIYKVYSRDEMYEQYDADRMPDLRAANRLGYRVSWQDTLGGLSTAVFEDNPQFWSGDHCSLEPSEVKGILFINRELTTDEPRMIDMAPSILNELGMEHPEDLDGEVAWTPR